MQDTKAFEGIADHLPSTQSVATLIDAGQDPMLAANVADLVREMATTIYHPVGTCRIGDVVDERLRVKGERLTWGCTVPAVLYNPTYIDLVKRC